MKKIFLYLFFSISLAGFSQTKSFYDFKVTDIHGKIFDFATLKGKKVMIVNTASKCSLAPQLNKLEELYEEYGGEDFEIIAFPCNDFGNREPADNEEIFNVYTQKFGITFPIMSKIKMKGDSMNLVFEWLTNSQKNGTLDAKVTWNFQKFLVDENGYVEDVIWPIGSPKSKRVEAWIEED